MGRATPEMDCGTVRCQRLESYYQVWTQLRDKGRGVGLPEHTMAYFLAARSFFYIRATKFIARAYNTGRLRQRGLRGVFVVSVRVSGTAYPTAFMPSTVLGSLAFEMLGRRL